MTQTRTGLATILAGAAVALAACGASSSPTSANRPAQQTPVQSGADVSSLAPRQAGPGHARTGQPIAVGAAKLRVHHARGVGGPTNRDDRIALLPKAQNPCSLVSVPEAESITGARLTGRIEAPLGPTCIYKFGTAQPTITVAVESVGLSKATSQLAKRHPLSVVGRSGYCGLAGRQMLFLPAGRGRVLDVTAPCALAERFAAMAVGRITA